MKWCGSITSAVGGTWTTAIVGIKAIGFGGAGIAAKSTAAALMSKAAIAGGGKIAAGSTIAVLQSVGATAVLANPIGVVVIGGALLGGSALINKARSTNHKPKL